MRTALVIAALLLPPPALAHEADDVPSRDQLVQELRGINSTLRAAQRRLDVSLSVDAADALRVISDAQVAFISEDYPRAALQLLHLVARPDIERHPGWPEALEYLAESLYALGLRRSGQTWLRRAVRAPKQLPTDYRRRLARLFELAGSDLKLPEMRRLWDRYAEDQPADEPVVNSDDAAIRYQYAKALVKHGVLQQADDLFASVPEGDPLHLKAQYFRGVVQLRGDHLINAEVAFAAALSAWERLRPEDAKRVYLEDVEAKGPARELVELKMTDDERLPPEAVTAHRRMGAVIHLALARLAAARNQDEVAWYHYRRVPRGDPDFSAALAEGTFVLFRREQFAWCARLVDQLLAGRGEDVSAAQLGLWKAQLLARAAEYDAAKLHYQALQQSLDERLAQLDTQLEVSKRVFPYPVLAWTNPDDAGRARRLEADLVTQEEALVEARELASTLEALTQSEDLLPSVAKGRELVAKLEDRMVHLRQHLELAGRVVHDEDDADPHSGGMPATQADLERFIEAAKTLDARIARFTEQLDGFETTYRKRIVEILAEEVPNIATFARALDDELQAARRLSSDLRVAARGNIERYAAEALFGQVDIAWWRKEEISRRIRETVLAGDAAGKAMERQPPTLEDPVEPADTAPAPRGDEDAEDDEDGAEEEEEEDGAEEDDEADEDEEDVDQEDVDQEDVDQEDVDQEDVDQEDVDQEDVDQEDVDQEDVDEADEEETAGLRNSTPIARAR